MSSILSTHSGHHRIFIGPVVQGRNNSNNNVTVTSTSTSHSHHKQNISHSKHSQAQAPKPWWEQGPSFLRSHHSLHNVSNSATTTPPLTNSSRATPATTPSPHQHPASSSQRQTNIPQFSYTFSDDDEHSNSSSSEVGDEEINVYDSEDERRDYNQDHDDNNNDSQDEQGRISDDDRINNNLASSSSESFSAPVAAGHSRHFHNQQQHGQQSSEESGQLQNVDSNGNPIKSNNKDKYKALAQDDAFMSRTTSVKRWRTGEKKRTKSMRDEGEPSRLKKILGARRHHKQNDDPDLGWESDGSR